MGSIYPNLDQKMVEVGLTIPVLAESLGLPLDVLLSRMNGETRWLLHEAVGICQLLNTSDVELLFVQLV